MNGPKYQAFTRRHLDTEPRLRQLPEDTREAIRTVSQVFPFKTNNYVVDELIDWKRIPDDPLFVLTFPQRDMLNVVQRRALHEANLLGDRVRLAGLVSQIRRESNPHPAGQLECNVPRVDGEALMGLQHKYDETVLFFPSAGQTCHAYCSFCFRWPQFIGIKELKFAAKEARVLVDYLHGRPGVTDILFTGGDPLIMKTSTLASYVEEILSADLPHVRSLRIGSKALSFWPYRFTSDPDADDLLRLFEKVVRSGKQLALMAHFSHPRELSTPAVRAAISRIRSTGAQIRTQSPVLSHVNDGAEIWAEMWREQVQLGLIPYYMFVARDTGAQQYFGLPLARALKIYREAYRSVSGLARTARGPSMSTEYGKVHIVGVSEIMGEQVFVLQMLQGRQADWAKRPFFAKYDTRAIWFDELQPAFGQSRFFFQEGFPYAPSPHFEPSQLSETPGE